MKKFIFIITIICIFFYGCDKSEEVLDIRTVVYSLEYTNVDMSGMTNSPSNNTMIEYMNAETAVSVNLAAPKKTWTQTVVLSKGDRAALGFGAPPNLRSGTATIKINCDNCKNTDFINGNGTIQIVYNLSINDNGLLDLHVE